MSKAFDFSILKRTAVFMLIAMLVFPSLAMANPYLISPYNGQTVNRNNPAFDWEDTYSSYYIAGFVLEISKSPATQSNGLFVSNVFEKVPINIAYYSMLLDGTSLSPGTYYWHIITFYTDYDVRISPAWRFTVPAPYTPPPPPAPPAPAPVAVKDTYKPRTYAKGTSARRKGKRKIATAKLRWKVRDNTSTVYVKLKIQKRVKSKLRVKRKARYLKRYRAYRGKYLSYKKQKSKTKNRTLARRYHRAAVKYKKAMNKYLRAYRKTKTVVYKTVKTPNYRWTRINKWRTYKWRTRSKGVYRYLVYAKDRANNSQRNVAKAGFRIR